MCRSRLSASGLGRRVAQHLRAAAWSRRRSRSLGSLHPDQQRIVRLAALVALHLDERPRGGQMPAQRRPPARRARPRRRPGSPARRRRRASGPAAAGDRRAEIRADHVDLPVDQRRARRRRWHRPATVSASRLGDGAPPPYRQAPAASAIAITSSSKRRAGSRTASAASACTGDRVGHHADPDPAARASRPRRVGDGVRVGVVGQQHHPAARRWPGSRRAPRPSTASRRRPRRAPSAANSAGQPGRPPPRRPGRADHGAAATARRRDRHRRRWPAARALSAICSANRVTRDPVLAGRPRSPPRSRRRRR